jgi:hypothetical protein
MILLLEFSQEGIGANSQQQQQIGCRRGATTYYPGRSIQYNMDVLTTNYQPK